MKITVINGSPKYGESTSELLIGYLMSFSDFDYTVHRPCAEAVADIMESEAVIFAFPLYVDGIPSHMLRFLNELEKQEMSPNTLIYCIVNNGFFEGRQNRLAIEQMKCWCCKSGVKWGCGVGVGAGEMLPFLKDVPLGYGPNKNLGNALKKLSERIAEVKGGEDMYVSPNWPRFLWKIQASTSFWMSQAKKNGLKKGDLYKRF